MADVMCRACGTVIGNPGKFCLACSEPLTSMCTQCGAQGRVGGKFCEECGASLISDRWACADREIAKRIEQSDVDGLLKKGLVVEPGNKAALVQDGKFAGILDGGFYNVKTLQRVASSLNLKAPVIVHLYNSKDIRVDFSIVRMYTAEELAVTVSANVVMMVERPERFLTNLVGNRDRFTVDNISEFMMGEVRQLLEPLVRERSVKDLYANQDLKREIERKAEDDLKITLDRNGLRLVQLRFVRYECTELDKAREQYPDLFLEEEAEIVEEKRQELRQRILSRKTEFYKVLKGAQKDDLLTDQEFEHLQRGIIEEKENYEILREFFVDKTGLLNEQELQEIHHALGVAQAKHEEETQDIAKDGEVGRMVTEKKARMDIDREWRANLADDEERRNRIKTDYIARLQEIGPAAMIAGLDDDGRAEMIRDLQQTEVMKGMSEEQVLAMAAKNSPEAAKALAEKFKNAEPVKMKEMYERMLALNEEQGARMERMFVRGMDSHRNVGATVVAGGGSGAVVVAGGGSGAVVVCRSCGSSIENPGKACPECGHEI